MAANFCEGQLSLTVAPDLVFGENHAAGLSLGFNLAAMAMSGSCGSGEYEAKFVDTKPV